MFARKCYDYYSATIRGLLVTIRYIGLSKAGRLTTLRLFHDYLSGETTTIARPYWLSGESPKRDTAVAVNGSAPPMPGKNIMPDVCQDNARLIRCQGSSRQVWEVSRPRRADPVPGAALASDLHTAGADPAGLAWSVICYTV